jgi:sulfite exporter TauE/SafE
MVDYAAAFGIGLVGSLHCLGMCGPLVLAYSMNLPDGERLRIGQNSLHHSLFHLGRLATYGFLGALAALLFYLADLDRVFVQIRGSMTLLGGALMIGIGLVLLRILPLPQGVSHLLADSGTHLSGRMGFLFRSRDLKSKVVLGLATGFLPCGLSWAMIVKAATTQHIGSGFLTMIAFGLGTVPALFLTGFSASFITYRLRTVGDKIAACSVIVMGAILVFKGARTFA